MAVSIDKDRCKGCGACVALCPVEALELKSGCVMVNQNDCVECGTCLTVCQPGALLL